MDANSEFHAAFGRQTRVAFDHAALNLDGAAHGIDHAAKFDENAVSGALDHAPMMHGDGRIDQVAPECPEPRQSAIFIGAGQAGYSRQYRPPGSPRVSGSRS